MIIDILVGAVLVISAIIAFLRGLIRETLTIAGVVGGVAAAYALGPALAIYMNRWLGVEEGVPPKRLFDIIPYNILSNVLSYGLIFLGVVIALSIISHMIAQSARALGLGPVDRTLGFVFGLLRGVILLGLLYLPVSLLVKKETKDEWFSDSKSYVYLEMVSGYIAQAFVPEEQRAKLVQEAEKIGDTLNAREKLQSIDVLKKDGSEPPQPSEAPQTPGTQDNKAGYTDQFRENMDRLFEQKTQPPQEGASP